MKAFLHFTQHALYSLTRRKQSFLVTFKHIYHCRSYGCDRVVLKSNIFPHNERAFSLRELVMTSEYFYELHALERELLVLLFAEEQNMISNIFSMSTFLKKFICIEKLFISDFNKKHMVIATIPGTDKQICLSIKQLLNHSVLLNSLKNAN